MTVKRRHRGWDYHNGCILYLCGASDAQIASLLKISKAAVQARRRRHWEFGRS